MRPLGRTSARMLVILTGVGLVIGVLLPPLAVRLGGNAPQLGLGPAGLLLLAAATVGYLARLTWVDLHRDGRRMHRQRSVVLLALAQASSRAAAIAAGGYAGFALASLDEVETRLGEDRVLHGGAAAVAALLLLAAALFLERALVIPEDDDEADESGPEAEAHPA